MQIYRVKRGMIPHQLSTINSLVLSAAHAQPLHIVLPRRKRKSNDNNIDQCGIQRQESDVNIRTEKPSTDDCTKSACSHYSHEINHHPKEISFKLESTEPDQTDISQDYNYHVMTLRAVKIELPPKEESTTKL